MAEHVTLTQVAGRTTTRWGVQTIRLERGYISDVADIVPNPDRSFIEVILVGENGLRKEYRWTGTAADADIVALNSANLTQNSLQKRILTKLVADGVLVGAVAGTVDD